MYTSTKITVALLIVLITPACVFAVDTETVGSIPIHIFRHAGIMICPFFIDPQSPCIPRLSEQQLMR